ncbi:hypothetical protein FQN60_001545, partial [Etheostoma spectabile]
MWSCRGPAVAEGLTERVPGTSAFLFGWADAPRHRGLAQRRREMGWFRKTRDTRDIRPDMGPQPRQRFGLTGEPQLLESQRRLWMFERGRKVLALPHEGAVEIACNVESVKGSPTGDTDAGDPWPCFSIGGQLYRHAPASLITARVAQLAGGQGVAVTGTALVGFTPQECRGLAELALSRGIAEFWKEQRR